MLQGLQWLAGSWPVQLKLQAVGCKIPGDWGWRVWGEQGFGEQGPQWSMMPYNPPSKVPILSRGFQEILNYHLETGNSRYQYISRQLCLHIHPIKWLNRLERALSELEAIFYRTQITPLSWFNGKRWKEKCKQLISKFLIQPACTGIPKTVHGNYQSFFSDRFV